MKIFYNSGEMPPSPFRVGNKAYNLARLQQLNYRPFQIPEFLAVATDVCREYFEQAGVVHTDAGEAVKKIEARKIDDEFIDPIYEAAQKLKPPLIARSSAIAEDSETSSAAGVFESYKVETTEKEDLERALRKCYASLFSQRAVLERKQTDEPVMGVLVQEYKSKPKISFTVETADAVDPSNPDPTRMRIASREGGTESMTAGTGRNPNMNIRKICTEEKLSQEANAIVEGSLFVERAMGRPQILEWVVCEDAIYLLQTRPLTTPRNFPITALDLERDARTHLAEPEEVKDALLRAGIAGSQVGSLIRAATHLNIVNPKAHQVPDEEVRAIFGESIFQLVCTMQAWPWSSASPSLQECIETGIERRRQWRKVQPRDGELKGKTACYRRPYVEGRAYVASKENPLANFEGGILVADDANPDIEPAIRREDFTAGITNQGDFTSHACIYARSYRKPFVVATANATERVKHGSTVGIHFGLDEAVIVEVKK